MPPAQRKRTAKATGAHFLDGDDIQGPIFPDRPEAEPYTTSFGLEINAEWRQNDGLVNTISALRPLSEPGMNYDSGSIQPGIWNVMPVVEGRDHMAFMGGLLSGDATGA